VSGIPATMRPRCHSRVVALSQACHRHPTAGGGSGSPNRCLLDFDAELVRWLNVAGRAPELGPSQTPGRLRLPDRDMFRLNEATVRGRLMQDRGIIFQGMRSAYGAMLETNRVVPVVARRGQAGRRCWEQD
jgi:hypothetical protein